MKKIVIIILTIILLGIPSFLYVNTLNKPVNNDTSKIEITIQDGSSAKHIASVLKQNNLIKNEAYFLFYAKNKNKMNLKSGVYEISSSYNLDTILDMLNTGARPIGEKITIKEGSTIKQIAQVLKEHNLIKEDEFISLANDKSNFVDKFPFLSDDSITTLEGYLYPETYFIKEGLSSSDIISMMLENTQNLFNQSKIFDIPANLSPYVNNINDLITLASIVEKESVNPDEKNLIAGVFIKRLQDSIPLQSCVTVEYVLGYHKERISYEDTQIDTPFNTYINKGLTPTPICSPTIETINAVKNYTPTDYLYFVAKKDGTHVFSKEYNEHLEATKQIYGEY